MDENILQLSVEVGGGLGLLKEGTAGQRNGTHWGDGTKVSTKGPNPSVTGLNNLSGHSLSRVLCREMNLHSITYRGETEKTLQKYNRRSTLASFI